MQVRNSQVRRCRSWLGLIGGWTVLVWCVLGGWAQEAGLHVPTVLEVGRQLEQERRWHEALVHYERALRLMPDHEGLHERLDTARVHWDVVRRYRDASFLTQLRSLSTREALALYNEVLSKIETYHVATPDWKRLFQHGWTTWEAATTEPEFLTANGWRAAPLSPEFGAWLRTQINQFRLANRSDVYNAAAYCAQRLHEHGRVPPTIVLLELTAGAVTALDTYSSFLTATQLEEVFSQIEGNFVGVGVEVKPEGHGLLIVTVITGGPAADAGMMAGERITAIDKRSLQEISPEQGADLLRGAEGSAVELEITSPNGAKRTVVLKRRRVEVPSVDNVQMLDRDHGIGYFRLSSFQKSTPREMDMALWQLHRQGMRTLIIDLRGNPGGLLTAAVEAADRFLSDGPIVATRGRNTNEDYDYRAHAVGTWKMPLALLVDSESASASEIFAAAIHGQRRGVIVGQRTFGKGSVQGIFPLQTARVGVRLTTAQFFGPDGGPINILGVTPDILVHTVARPDVPGGSDVHAPDATLHAALQWARNSAAPVVAGR